MHNVPAMVRLRRVGSFALFVAKRFAKDRCNEMAASLTYTTLLSLVPLLTIAVAVLATFPMFIEITTAFKIFLLTNFVPELAGKVITQYMFQFSENAAKLTALGIAFLAVTAFLLMQTIDKALNAIWRVPKQRPFLGRVLIYWAVLTLGPILIGGSLSVSSYLVSLSMGLVPDLPWLGELMLKAIPTVLTTLAFAWLYLTVPNRYTPPAHALVGGLIAGAAFELMKKLFALYITHFGSLKLVYGAFASFPIFLLWIYASWLVVLAGAEIAASLSYWRGGAWKAKRTPGTRFFHALRILQVLYGGFTEGRPVSLRQLRREVILGLDELENLLMRLSAAGIVERVGRGGWVLLKDPGRTTVSELFQLLVLDPQSLVHELEGQEEAGMESTILALIRQTESEMTISLRDLFDPPQRGQQAEMLTTA